MAKLAKRWLSSEEQELWRAFLGAQYRLFKLLNDDMEEKAGFDHLTYEIFVNLSESENHSMRMADLAKSVSAIKSKLTYRINLLEEEGLVKRTCAEEDGRGQLCILTKKGYAILEKFAPYHVEAVLENFVEAFDPSEIESCTKVLNKIANQN